MWAGLGSWGQKTPRLQVGECLVGWMLFLCSLILRGCRDNRTAGNHPANQLLGAQAVVPGGEQKLLPCRGSRCGICVWVQANHGACWVKAEGMDTSWEHTEDSEKVWERSCGSRYGINWFSFPPSESKRIASYQTEFTCCIKVLNRLCPRDQGRAQSRAKVARATAHLTSLAKLSVWRKMIIIVLFFCCCGCIY